MDENYLDNLLNDLSNDEEQENIDINISEDSGVNLDLSDLGDISLDELDELDDIDLSSLELDDIDFDDVDVTKLDESAVSSGNSFHETEDFDMSTLLEDEDDVQDMSAQSIEDIADMMQAADEYPGDAASDGAADTGMPNGLAGDDGGVFEEAETAQQFDEDFMGMVMNEEESTEAALSQSAPETAEDTTPKTAEEIDQMDLDDLFSALGIDDDKPDEENYTANQDKLDDLLNSSTEFDFEDGDISALEEIEEKDAGGKGSKKRGKKEKGEKKSLSVILFGEPDADEEEENKAYEEKKAEQKEQKQALKEEKKVKKQEKQALKQRANAEKKQAKEQEKQEKLAEISAELELEKDEKKVSVAVVAIVFSLFAVLCVLVVFGSKGFNYSQAIKKAADYFDRQRYRLAYDEVSGVEIKKDDQNLKDRIYTVMYVERLYESYENNISIGYPDRALDALIRGLEKYELHYQEAVSLNIVEDIDSCKAKIVAALNETYGLSEEEAYEIISLDGQAYSSKLTEISAKLKQ
ncbi:MAG: hypothetical protein NC225_08030 [Clostridium sp.]|nr:hypothetical protein [Clostridium sp.]MCM1399410.1 hypothetical protein [Clostridium sp.]MCM1459964.1 hypothetical protein [Bacteroides sp.]